MVPRKKQNQMKLVEAPLPDLTPIILPDKQEIIDLIAKSEVNRSIELFFFRDVLHFSSTVYHPAIIQHIDEKKVYIVVPRAGEWEKPLEDDALTGEYLTIVPLDLSFAEATDQVQRSFYDPNVGHVLEFSNYVMKLHLRKFVRVSFDEKIRASIVCEGQKLTTEEIEIQGLNISGRGIAARCRRGCGLTRETVLSLKISNLRFPGYNLSQKSASVNGKVVYVLPSPDLPDCENIGIEFLFEEGSEGLIQADRIQRFCVQVSFAEHKERVEAGLGEQYGTAFQKPKIRLKPVQRSMW